MQCVSPIWLPDRKLFVPCSKCNFCLQRRRMGWSVRLFEELREAATASFLTFTYAPEFEVFDVKSREGTFEKSHLQNFWKRIRKFEGRDRSPIKYYAVAEYGGVFGRPHYHAIAFNMRPSTLDHLSRIWGHGFVHVGKVEQASVNYVTGYVINDDGEGVKPFPFSCMSKGLGKSYLSESIRLWHNPARGVYRGYYSNEGVAAPLPRYYREKLFSTAQREIMAVRASNEAQKAMDKEIDRMRSHSTDPWDLVDQMVRQKYDRIRINKTQFQ